MQVSGFILSALSFCDLVWYVTRRSSVDSTVHSVPVDWLDAAIRLATFVSTFVIPVPTILFNYNRGDTRLFCVGVNLRFTDVSVRTLSGGPGCHPRKIFENAICVVMHFKD